jgi:hypothetical protein
MKMLQRIQNWFKEKKIKYKTERIREFFTAEFGKYVLAQTDNKFYPRVTLVSKMMNVDNFDRPLTLVSKIMMNVDNFDRPPYLVYDNYIFVELFGPLQEEEFLFGHIPLTFIDIITTEHTPKDLQPLILTSVKNNKVTYNFHQAEMIGDINTYPLTFRCYPNPQ